RPVMEALVDWARRTEFSERRKRNARGGTHRMSQPCQSAKPRAYAIPARPGQGNCALTAQRRGGRSRVHPRRRDDRRRTRQPALSIPAHRSDTEAVAQQRLVEQPADAIGVAVFRKRAREETLELVRERIALQPRLGQIGGGEQLEQLVRRERA